MHAVTTARIQGTGSDQGLEQFQYLMSSFDTHAIFHHVLVSRRPHLHAPLPALALVAQSEIRRSFSLHPLCCSWRQVPIKWQAFGRCGDGFLITHCVC